LSDFTKLYYLHHEKFHNYENMTEDDKDEYYNSSKRKPLALTMGRNFGSY